MQPTLLILAAGMGSRYGGLKQMDQFGPSGETIIDYSIYDAIRAGFGKVVFIIRESLRNDFEEVFGKKYEGKIKLEFVSQELDKIPSGIAVNPERVKPWGTAHAVLMAKDVINEPFAVINADDFYGKDAFEKMGAYLSGLEADDTTSYSMVGYYLHNTLSDHGSVNRGICETDAEGNLTIVTERTKIERNADGVIQFPDEEGAIHSLGEDTVVSMNMWGCIPAVFDQCEQQFSEFLKDRGQELKSEFYIPTLISNLIDSNDAVVKVLNTDAEWFGVTYKEDKPVVVENLNRLVSEGIYPSNLWAEAVS